MTSWNGPKQDNVRDNDNSTIATTRRTRNITASLSFYKNPAVVATRYIIATSSILFTAGIILLLVAKLSDIIDAVSLPPLRSLHSALYTFFFPPFRSHYVPSAGVVWYLEALVFPSMEPYFSLLVHAQPLVFALPVAIRMSASAPLAIIGAQAIVAIVIFSKKDMDLADIGFLFSLLLCNEAIVAKMRFVAIILFATLASAVVSPLMLSLWVTYGSGNANFLFFQGLTMSLCLSAFIIEFLRSALTCECNEDNTS